MTPRYSDRLDQEAQKDRGMLAYWQFQVGGAATMAAMLTRMTTTAGTLNTSALVGAGVGGLWLLGGTLMGALYDPYRSGQKAVAALPKGTTREQLTRERVAESEIEGAESVVSKLRTTMLVTDLFAAFYFMAGGSNGFSMTSDLPVVATVILSGFVPYLFKPSVMVVAEQQRDYRKKIFAPVASLGLHAESASSAAHLVPSLQLSWRF